MVTFFNRILYFAIGLIKAYFFIGFIAVILILLIIIGFAIDAPDDCTDFFNQHFVNLDNNVNPDDKLRPYDVTAIDRVFLAILMLITILFIWPCVFYDCIREN